MFKIPKSKRKEELLRLRKENEKLRDKNRNLKFELWLARDIIGDMAIKINNDVSEKEYYSNFEKARVLYQLLAQRDNDFETIKEYYPWLIPNVQDEI